MAMFKGFKPQGLQKIATRMGYAGSMEKFDDYIKENPDKEREMIVYRAKAQEMARGGSVRRFAEGGNTGTFDAKFTTAMVGEDGPPDFGRVTTMAVPEDGDYSKLPGGGEVTTRAVPEDGDYSKFPGGGIGGAPPTQSTPSYTPADQAYVTTLGESEGQVPAYGTTDEPKPLTEATTTIAQTGAMPVGGVTQPQLTPVMQEQIIDPTTGQLSNAPVATANTANTTTAADAQNVTASTYDATKSTDEIRTALEANLPAQTDPNDPRAKVIAAQQTKSAVSDLDAAQGNAYIMENPVQREIQDGELISGVADAEKAAKFTEQIEAATATPSEKATVQGQLEGLTANFDANNPPSWAAGTLRGIQAQMAARGMGASSMAGQAMLQGALESALPIAQADAATTASFEAQNLSNRQARAMLAAEQRATFLGQEFDQEFKARVQNSARIGDIANMNFTAEQNIAMENSRAVNTMNLQNLSNKQGMVMAEAAALANLDMANLSNNQQAAVQNAQNFLQMDMANLSNEQQTAMFNAQALNQSILTDQAADNASKQFNATSENQTKQFMANLANNVSQFNATQANAQAQFNAGEENTIERFNAEVRNQRDQFNAQNQVAIAQNNAVWRREVATADTAAINRANELNAKAVLDISNTAYNNLWSFYSDTIEWAWKSAESEQDRINALAVAEVSKEAQEYAANASKAAAGKTALGAMIGTIGAALI